MMETILATILKIIIFIKNVIESRCEEKSNLKISIGRDDSGVKWLASKAGKNGIFDGMGFLYIGLENNSCADAYKVVLMLDEKVLVKYHCIKSKEQEKCYIRHPIESSSTIGVKWKDKGIFTSHKDEFSPPT